LAVALKTVQKQCGGVETGGVFAFGDTSVLSAAV
jgi:hypothetical protein